MQNKLASGSDAEKHQAGITSALNTTRNKNLFYPDTVQYRTLKSMSTRVEASLTQLNI